MHPIIRKTLGGLSSSYYFRQLFFGLILASFPFYMSFHTGKSMPFSMVFLIVVNTLLYPYSRFVYESVIGFIMGNNIFFVNGFVMILSKLFTMVMCWGFALFVAPIGLAYLYFYHSRMERS